MKLVLLQSIARTYFSAISIAMEPMELQPETRDIVMCLKAVDLWKSAITSTQYIPLYEDFRRFKIVRSSNRPLVEAIVGPLSAVENFTSLTSSAVEPLRRRAVWLFTKTDFW